MQYRLSLRFQIKMAFPSLLHNRITAFWVLHLLIAQVGLLSCVVSAEVVYLNDETFEATI
jgi:hypothetical protein